MKSLPEELMSIILGFVFLIPDDLFTDNERRSPFVAYKYPHATSSLLLVNKTWCRIGIPLLYHDVIIRSMAQAKALAFVLGTKKELRRWVRSIRVEGGFGRAMRDILQACNHISDLCLLLVLYHNDSAEGTCSSLKDINPKRLTMLTMSPYDAKSNGNMRQLRDALCAAIPQWHNLTAAAYAVPRESGTADDEIIRTLSRVPSLSTVTLLKPSLIARPYHRVLCESPTIHAVVIRIGHSILLSRFHEQLVQREAEVVQQKLRLEVVTDEPPRRKPLYIRSSLLVPATHKLVIAAGPVASATIWTRILQLAMDLPDSTFSFNRNSRNLELLLVCRYFYRYGCAALLQNPLVNRHNVNPLAAHLIAHPDRVKFVQRLTIDPDLNDHCSLEPLLRVVRNLKGVEASPGCITRLCWSDFLLLAQMNASTLHHLHGVYVVWDINHHHIAPLCWLNNLRELRWSSDAIFDVGASMYVDALSMLEHLDIGCCSKSFVDILTLMSLNSLRNITLRYEHRPTQHVDNFRALLCAHGRKISEIDVHGLFDPLILTTCPYVESVTVHGQPIMLHVFMQMVLHAAPQLILKKIRLSDLDCNSVKLFVEALDFAQFPALREIHCLSFAWPANELKHRSGPNLLTVVENLEDRSVRVYDAHGVYWKPRLR
ncbi:hypothetical protein BD626DRAFT_612380 [Schizophyllum amplum]|uniref:Uncharacterized protein n=1 Tax=Schizophyllum amplum TaxID=97359 RepID=A0A550CLR6_9AGAR|nr:hypothetical protein BD626DRAFT_612380 [Auriculariopsis ampla]